MFIFKRGFYRTTTKNYVSSPGDDFAPEDIGNVWTFFGCHSWGWSATDIKWAEAWDVAKYLTMHKTVPHKRIIRPRMSRVVRLRNCFT